MDRLSIYVLFVLIFLGVSSSFSPSEQGAYYIIDQRVFANYFKAAPVSLVLADSFQTGFLIKSYFQKYKVIYGFRPAETVIVRTSKAFWHKNLSNLGMSLFRRNEDGTEHSIPMPPGTMFLGNLAFGSWQYERGADKVWRFHRAYRSFPQMFGWNGFIPTYDFYENLKRFDALERPFYGLNNEFGSDGSVTKKNYEIPDEGLQEIYFKARLRAWIQKRFSISRFENRGQK